MKHFFEPIEFRLYIMFPSHIYGIIQSVKLWHKKQNYKLFVIYTNYERRDDTF